MRTGTIIAFPRRAIRVIDIYKNNIITKKDYELACIEADNINVGDSIYQSLWIASGIK